MPKTRHDNRSHGDWLNKEKAGRDAGFFLCPEKGHLSCVIYALCDALYGVRNHRHVFIWPKPKSLSQAVSCSTFWAFGCCRR